MNNNNQTRGKGGKVCRRLTLPPGAIIIINKLFARSSHGRSLAGIREELHRVREIAGFVVKRLGGGCIRPLRQLLESLVLQSGGVSINPD
ncbi:MAG: hypothetical protein ACRC62_25320 [Microcoleus sp.]